MRFLKLHIRYDGTDFAGWQAQDDQPTVQVALEQAWAAVTQESVRILASGRTDAGVHALCQVCGVRTETRRDEATLLKALNAHLPETIVALSVEPAPEGFHPIRDSLRKRYRYVIDDGRPPNPFLRKYAWQWPRGRLDDAAMALAAKHLVGKHDFAAFEATGAPRSTTIRTVSDLSLGRVTGDYGETLRIEIESDGFLYNMVRNIVGSLVEVGRGAQPPEWIGHVRDSRDRKNAGPTAPPQGLFLVRVEYGPPSSSA